MFSGMFGDVQTAQSIRLQKGEMPTIKSLLIMQISVYLNQRYTCYRDRQLDAYSVQALMALLEDLHTILSLRDYRIAKDTKTHKERFTELKSKYEFEIKKFMNKKMNDDNSKLEAATAVMPIINEIFELETKYLERFGLVEPEDVIFTQEDAFVEIISDEYKQAEKEYNEEKEKAKPEKSEGDSENDTVENRQD